MRFPTTNKTLIKRLAERDNEVAWSDFFALYKDIIYDVARFKGLTEDEAQEVVQTVMIRFNNRVKDNFKYDANLARFRTFLSLIIKGAIFDQFKRRVNSVDLPCEIIDEEQPDELLDMMLISKWRNFLKEQAIEELKEQIDYKTFQIFDLYVLQNCPPNEVARLLDTSTSNVYTVKSRCLDSLEKIISRMNSEDQELDLDV